IDKQRPYLHNTYRLPFVNAIYQFIEERRLSIPPLEDIDIAPPFLNYQSQAWETILPSLLGSILSKVDRIDQIVPQILEIREGKAARQFRSYYRELHEKLGEPSASIKLDKELKYLSDLWNGISDPISLPVFITFADWEGLQLRMELPQGIRAWIERQYTKLSKRHLRFAINLFEHKEQVTQLSTMINKIFRPTHKVL
ncbi:MAG: hypothetical protein PVJ08_03385, partial [Dehalococcoidia bacterium]